MGYECHGLQKIALLQRDTFSIPLAERCKLICYSNALCSHWQYGDDGCYFGQGTNCTKETPWTKTMVAGEEVEHFCEPEQEEEKECMFGSDFWLFCDERFIPFLVMSCLLCLVCCLLCRTQRQKKLKTRVHHLEVEEEVDGDETEPLTTRSDYEVMPVVVEEVITPLQPVQEVVFTPQPVALQPSYMPMRAPLV